MLALSYNINGLRGVSLDQAVHEVANAGYDAVELSLHPRHIDPFDVTPADARRLRGTLDAAGIVACCLATGADTLLGEERFEPSLIHPSEAGRAARVDLIRRGIEFAAWAGVPVLNFASGIRKPEVSPEQARRWLLDGIRRCLDLVDSDLVLAMEPEPGFFAQTNDEVAALVAEVGSDRFAVCQDLGHCRVVEDDYLASVERTLPVTRHIQVEDIKGRHHHHEIPGDGDIDFAAFVEVLRRNDYSGYLSVELYNHSEVYREALRRSHDHLRALLPATATA